MQAFTVVPGSVPTASASTGIAGGIAAPLHANVQVGIGSNQLLNGCSTRVGLGFVVRCVVFFKRNGRCVCSV